MEALQVRERGDEINVLGASEFYFPAVLNPYDGPLGSLARKMGAHYVIVASKFIGKSTGTEYLPMTSFSSAYFGGRHGFAVSETSTSIVPTEVTRDQYVFHAIFLRKSATALAQPN